MTFHLISNDRHGGARSPRSPAAAAAAAAPTATVTVTVSLKTDKAVEKLEPSVQSAAPTVADPAVITPGDSSEPASEGPLPPSHCLIQRWESFLEQYRSARGSLGHPSDEGISPPQAECGAAGDTPPAGLGSPPLLTPVRVSLDVGSSQEEADGEDFTFSYVHPRGTPDARAFGSAFSEPAADDGPAVGGVLDFDLADEGLHPPPEASLTDRQAIESVHRQGSGSSLQAGTEPLIEKIEVDGAAAAATTTKNGMTSTVVHVGVEAHSITPYLQSMYPPPLGNKVAQGGKTWRVARLVSMFQRRQGGSRG